MPDTERELFESAMDDTPEVMPVAIVEPEKPQVEPEKPAEGEQVRDEQGRFAPKAKAGAEPEKPAKAKEPEAQKQEESPAAPIPVKEPEQGEDRIPSWRLKEEAEAKREAQRRAEEAERNMQTLQAQMMQMRQQLQQTQQPNTPKPNLFENPEAWEQTQQQTFQSALQQQQLQFSEQLARIKYGDETYDAADKAAQQVMASGQMDPTLVAVGKSSNPGVALVEWHKRKQTLERLGNLDPDKYVEQEIEKRLNDPQFLAKAVERARTQAQAQPGPATNNPVKTIPSLNRQTSAASSADGEDESDRSIFKSALTR